ncbi:hypothetical protein HDV05_001634, partial [Chytridiales sp. JEL 0842]
FHQPNLRTAGLRPEQTIKVGPTGPLSNYNIPANSSIIPGSTPAYTAAPLSMHSAWTEAIVAAFQQVVNWPLISVKLDDMDTMFVDRAIRDNAKIKLTSTVSAEGVQGFKVSSQFPCVAPVTFPIGVKEADVAGLQAGWKREQVGLDPLTVWVPLEGNGAEVSLGFKSAGAVPL